jgi:ABC-2 type transport system permease protein
VADLVFEIGMLRRLIQIQVRSQMQYRFGFWVDLIGTGLFSAGAILSFYVALTRFGSIGGWTLGEVAFLYGMIEIGFGLMDLIFGGFDPDEFSIAVRQGTFTQVLLRPIGLWTQVLGSKFIMRRLGRCIQGILVLLIAVSVANITWTPLKLLYLPLVLLAQVLCYGSLFVVGAALTFFTIERVEAMNIVTYGSTEMTQYPMSVYPLWLRNVFTFIVPTIFMNYYPALYFLDKPDPLGFPAAAPFFAPFVSIAMLCISYVIWRFGLRHYQGTGS